MTSDEPQRYAVYILAIEDTEDADLNIARLGAVTVDRLGGSLTFEEAVGAVDEAVTINWDYAV